MLAESLNWKANNTDLKVKKYRCALKTQLKKKTKYKAGSEV